jgi:hypothetical protein
METSDQRRFVFTLYEQIKQVTHHRMQCDNTAHMKTNTKNMSWQELMFQLRTPSASALTTMNFQLHN